MSRPPLRIGVIGLGRAFTLMLPTFLRDPRVQLVGAADPIPQARAQFEKDFSAPSHDNVEALCADPQVQAVYIATPHQLHAEHVRIAAAAGKHMLVEKPMALTLQQCTDMIDAAQRAGVQLVVGHSHSFDAPIRRTRELIASGRFGRLRMITALNYTDYLYRPRRPEELETEAGGGVIHSQAAHQIDIVRLLAGGLVRRVRAQTGAWDVNRPTEGAYSAILGFDAGVFATVIYSGYGHFDSDTLMDGVGELGQRKNAHDHGAARRRLAQAASAADEAALKAARNYGGRLYVPSHGDSTGLAHQHFGPVIVSCEGADLRPTPHGVAIDADDTQYVDALAAPAVPRQEVIDELCAAVLDGKAPVHSGAWARATTEVCLGMLASARSQADFIPGLQVGHNS